MCYFYLKFSNRRSFRVDQKLPTLLVNGMKKTGYKTMSSLADDSGITSGMLSRYKNNQSIPNYSTLKVLSRALDIPYIEMITAARGSKYPSSPKSIEEEQTIDDETYRYLIEICKMIYDKNISLRTAFLELLAKKFPERLCAYFHKLLCDHERWIKHLDENPQHENYHKEGVYKAHAKRLCLRIFTRMLDHDYTWILGFQSELKYLLDHSASKDIKLQKKVDIMEMKYQFILTLDGKEFTDKEIERIINFTRFERGDIK